MRRTLGLRVLGLGSLRMGDLLGGKTVPVLGDH